MFNKGWISPPVRVEKATYGCLGNYDTTSATTLYAGVDPADSRRVLVRKLVQISPYTYGYEEIRMTPSENGPIYHSTLFRLKDFDLKEKLSSYEIQMRGSFRAIPNVIGFSLFSIPMTPGINNCTLVENSIYKSSGQGWLEWFQDFRDRRDTAAYLRWQWSRN